MKDHLITVTAETWKLDAHVQQLLLAILTESDLEPADISLFAFCALCLIAVAWTVRTLRRKTSLTQLFWLIALWAILVAFIGFILRNALPQLL